MNGSLDDTSTTRVLVNVTNPKSEHSDAHTLCEREKGAG